jgi:sugar lactone lactonase YvrE
VTFDGANVWVSDISEKKVTKLRASDGARQGDFAVGGRPGWMSSDGENLWVPVAVGAGQGSLYKIRESDGKILGTFALGISPIASAFDGASTWVTGGNSILKVRSDGSVAGTFPAGGSPLGICVERDNVWVANRSGGTVSKMRRSDGLLLGTYRVGGLPYGVLFDGSEMWVTGDPETVVLRAGDGTRVMRPDLGLSATTGQVFDGVNIWAAALNRGALLKRER